MLAWTSVPPHGTTERGGNRHIVETTTVVHLRFIKTYTFNMADAAETQQVKLAKVRRHVLLCIVQLV
mgnify:CR=1 FL=1|jgi:hypothetical protein